MVSIRCAHGDTVLYPLAVVDIEVEGIPVHVEAAVVDTLPVEVLLRTDVSELPRLLGKRASYGFFSQEDVMVVMTRARKKQEIQKEVLLKEKEVLSGVVPKPLNTEGVTTPRPLSQEQKRCIRKDLGTKTQGEGLEYCNMDATKMKELQEKDVSLSEAREAARKTDGTKGEWFYREGLLYRRWTPRGRGDESEVEQLVLPKACRHVALVMSHDIPIAGHLGRDKTRQRLLRRFFWPTVFRDVEEYCRTCGVCQKATQRGVQKAPLVPLPIVSEPFSRIAMDIVGPLLRSRSGNKYLLVICDYATRYPEAVPLKSIDAESVAEELIKVFARVGVPREILTDQGSNFTSQLLAELYRLLQVRPIRTSPYHPETDGLVERFNQTLKSMLRKAVTDTGKDWDKMIPYLLFAYREVPQASTGFSPFELLYGRDVRGPLDVLRDTWESGTASDENVISYVLSTREKLSQMAEVVKENLTKAQRYQKTWYDKGARLREFITGDLVLVLLPTTSNKLLAQWQGPYQVLQRMGKVTYLIDMQDKKKRKRIFHVNMLKDYHVREGAGDQVSCFSEEYQEDELEIPSWRGGESEKIVRMGEELDSKQRAELTELLIGKFARVMSDKPGRTSLYEHRIETDNAKPVRSPPYRLPHAYRERVRKELIDMEKGGIIEPTCSDWASPIVVDIKKNGELRLCVDFRKVNAVTRVDAYLMPRIDYLIDGLGKASLITTLDLTTGYWQIPVAEKDR